jgi:hypothetical protein
MADDNKLPLHLRQMLFAKDAGDDDVDAGDKQLETRKLNGLLHPQPPSDTAQRMVIKSLFATDCEDDVEDLVRAKEVRNKSKRTTEQRISKVVADGEKIFGKNNSEFIDLVTKVFADIREEILAKQETK